MNSGASWRSPRITRVILAAVRVTLLLAAFQLTGFTRIAAIDCCLVSADGCSESDDGKPCNDCPPECPLCHCVQSLASLPPRIEADGPVPATADTPRPVLRPYEADAPRAPPPSSIFRPPKPLTRIA